MSGCWFMSENALRNGDFWESLVEAYRPESDDVGVGWGQDWGQKSKSNWLTSSARGCRQRLRRLPRSAGCLHPFLICETLPNADHSVKPAIRGRFSLWIVNKAFPTFSARSKHSGELKQE